MCDVAYEELSANRQQNVDAFVVLMSAGRGGAKGPGAVRPRTMPGPVYRTTADATRAAETLGFSKINQRVAGEAVYRRGNRFITRDRTGHNGGAWKMADSVNNLARKETRMGTFDSNLNRIGD